MDTFFEQIVRRKKTTTDLLLLSATVAGAFFLAYLSLWLMQYIGMLFIVLLAGVIVGLWWVFTMTGVEFEYSVTNGDIDIDQITGKRNRKRIVSVAGRRVESCGRYSADVGQRAFDRKLMTGPSPLAKGLWYFTYRSKKNGHTLVIFQPNEKVLPAFIDGLDKRLQAEIKRDNDIH